MTLDEWTRKSKIARLKRVKRSSLMSALSLTAAKTNSKKDPHRKHSGVSFRIRAHLKGYSLFYSCIGVTLVFVVFYAIEP